MDRGISALLTQLLSEIFIINENDNHIQAAILTGSLCLENLIIKKQLFDEEKAPITLCHGSIGRIEFIFPWNNLGNEPIQIIIEDLFILCKPQYKRDTMEMKLKREHRRKRALISALDAFANSKPKSIESEKTKSNSTFQYFTRLVAERVLRSVLNNVEIRIQNIHVRYEDQISCGTEFSIGFTMESFILKSINEPQSFSTFGIFTSLFTSNTQPIYQRCTVDTISVYVNQLVPNPSHPALINFACLPFANKSSSEIVTSMKKAIPKRYQKFSEDVGSVPKHQYLIHPFHSTCDLEISLGTYDEMGNLVSNDIQV